MKKEQFDSIIKHNLLKVYGERDFGYILSKTYDNYYSKEAFERFKDEMQTEKYSSFYELYIKGKGSELKERGGRYGTMPPKMASVASSSRFCYLALRDGASALGGKGKVEFECERRIKGISGTAPQLDAGIPDDNIYVEAKCHEIFDMHKVALKIKYWDYIYGKNNDFGLSAPEKPDSDTFEIPLSVFGIFKSDAMFDIKQFLCHLLGIASQKKCSDEAKLVYLFFKPKSAENKNEIDEIFTSLQQEIESIFNCEFIKSFIEKNNIGLLAVAEYSERMQPLTKDNMILLVSA